MSSLQAPLSQTPLSTISELESPRRGIKRTRSQAGLESPSVQEEAATDMRDELMYIPVTKNSPASSTEPDVDARSPVLLLTFAVAAFSTAAQLHAELSKVTNPTHIASVILPLDMAGSSTGSAYVTFQNADIAQDVLDTIAVSEVGVGLFGERVLVADFLATIHWGLHIRSHKRRTSWEVRLDHPPGFRSFPSIATSCDRARSPRRGLCRTVCAVALKHPDILRAHCHTRSQQPSM